MAKIGKMAVEIDIVCRGCGRRNGEHTMLCPLWTSSTLSTKGIVCPGCGGVGEHVGNCMYVKARLRAWGRKPDPEKRESGKNMREALVLQIERALVGACRGALNDYQQKFLEDMLKRAKVPGFFPSQKQAELLNRITDGLDRLERTVRGFKVQRVAEGEAPAVIAAPRRRLRVGEK